MAKPAPASIAFNQSSETVVSVAEPDHQSDMARQRAVRAGVSADWCTEAVSQTGHQLFYQLRHLPSPPS